MATYNKNEMLPQSKEALERWNQYLEFWSQVNVASVGWADKPRIYHITLSP
ncbi:integrase [Legionella cincinnatiensis]|uniref:Integrase n=1 Tax=Legionella cincinnatiensis TaxID=28085 RepID=A0A378IQ49_9GAMM|nr:hypothetical protein [Legionella cincinnatiensis]KTC82713.1 integrase [Legionella cincinnatiensis]STX34144.1 integrase [Legionella cincinnatiensis]